MTIIQPEPRSIKARLFIRNNVLDATALFADLKEVVEKDRSDGVVIDRHHPAKKVLNRFSAQYFSPSGVKGFRDCPANQIIQTLLPFEGSEVTEIGKRVHAVLESFYNLDGPDRDTAVLYDIMDVELAEHGQEESRAKVKHYIDGFKATPDYLDPSKEMDHKGLVCYNELFMKGSFSPLGVKLPLDMYSLSDRIDFRDDVAYVIDYKTGTYLNPKILTMDGYLPQIIAYKWGIEETYGVEVAGGFLLVPGTKQKIVELNINSLENQSRYIDIIFDYKEQAQRCAETRLYPIKDINKYTRAKLDKYARVEEGPDGVVIEIDYDITLKPHHLPENGIDENGDPLPEDSKSV